MKLSLKSIIAALILIGIGAALIINKVQVSNREERMMNEYRSQIGKHK